MERQRKKVYVMMIGLIVVMMLAACGDNGGSTPPPVNTANEEGQAETETEVETERKMTDPIGNEVLVPTEPQRIIASYLEDHLLAVGVKPIAQWSIGERPMLYLQNELEGIPNLPWDLPFEVVASHDPDLIIVGSESTVSEGKYDSYAKIAPTYVLGDEVNGDWRQSLLSVGHVLGKSDEAQRALDNYDAKVEEAKQQLNAAYESPPSVAAIWLTAKTFWVASVNLSSGAVMYGDLGLTVPDIIDTISSGEGGNWKSLSLEALAQLDADHVFLINSDIDTGSEALNDVIWQNIKAVKSGNVHEFGPETSWLYTGAIANEQIIDHILDSLIK